MEKGAILGATIYKNGLLVARDVTVTLPSVNYKTQEIAAMGTIELPMLGQIEAMEASVTKKGYSAELAALAAPEASDLEVRFVQSVTGSDASSSPRGCRAFMRAVAKTMPGSDLTPGEAGDTQVTFAVTRYQLFVEGIEACLVDQIKNIQRINGKDYAKNINSLL